MMQGESNISETQVPSKYLDEINKQIDIFENGTTIQVVNSIPPTKKIPIDKQGHWLKIPNVICVFVDMLGSTRLSAGSYEQSTASAYQLFTGTAVRLFDVFESPYIDVRGDGVFALFDSTQPYRAIASAVTFKTFANQDCIKRIKDQTGIEIGTHIGIDQKTVLVRKIGMRKYDDRTDRQNEVWAGKPINMAAKLASLSQDDEILVSDRYFANIQNDFVLLSCGCSAGEPGGEKKHLWDEKDVSEDERFDFDMAHSLGSLWCERHGQEYLEGILALDEED